MEDIKQKVIDNNLNTINIENNDIKEKRKRYVNWFYFVNLSVLIGTFQLFGYFKDCNGVLPTSLGILNPLIILCSIILVIFVFIYNIKNRNSIFFSIFMFLFQLILLFIIFILSISHTLVLCSDESYNTINIPTFNFKQNSLPVSSTTIINNQ